MLEGSTAWSIIHTICEYHELYDIIEYVFMCMYGEGSEFFWFHFFGALCLCLEIASIHYPGKLGAGS